MAKRDIIGTIASVTAAVSVWTELGREFKLGDSSCGEVGLVNTVGRLALKVTCATLTYALTDCCFEWLFNAKDKIVTEVKEKKEDSVEETEKTEFEGGYDE